MRRKKQEKLIPFEKRRRVIYVYQHRKRRSARAAAGWTLVGLGGLCLLYCLFILFFMSFGTWFFLIWGLAGLALAIWGGLLVQQKTKGIPGWAKLCWGLLAGIGLTALLVVEGLIFTEFDARAEPGADYCMILGAQMKDDGPSDVLKRRLDRALSYLQESPETLVIVSGGRGGNEQVSEAQGMYDYLVDAGIAPERILMEEASRNTHENLEFSGRLLDLQRDRVVLVTNNFHMYRTLQLAEGAGYMQIQGLAATTDPWMLPNNLLREFFGVVKDFCAGNF